MSLGHALSLWMGPSFGELAATSFARGEASRLDDLRLSATEDLMSAKLGAGRHRELCGELETLVGEQPYRERLWELWMLALYRSGRQTEALRAFDRVRRLLVDELGVVPGQPLQELHLSILAHDPVLRAERSRPASIAMPGTGGGRSPLPGRLHASAVAGFVGRSAEMQVLLDALEAVRRQGLRQIVVVSGEPGIGKTALSAAFAAQAITQGAAVTYGRCDQDAGAPYEPWALAVAHLLSAEHDAQLDAVVAEHGAHLAKLGGPLAPLRTTDPFVGDPEMSRYLLFHAVLSALVARSDGSPTVVVLDDLHWFDAPSLLLLRHLVTFELSTPVLVVGTCRTSELRSTPALLDLLAEMHAQPGVRRLELGGLTSDELSKFARVHSDLTLVDDSGAAVCAALARETDGNPLFAGELLRHLLETGIVSRSHDGTGALVGDVTVGGSPTSLRDLILHRVRSLGDDARTALSVAAVIGRDFALDVVASACLLDEEIVLDVLERACDAQLVLNVGGDDFSFTHALIARALCDSLTPARRKRAHRTVANMLEARSEPGGTSPCTELAYHFTEAAVGATEGAELNKAIRYTSAAAANALRQLAPHEAVRWYELSLELLDRRSDDDPELRCTLLVGLGDAQRQCGEAAFAATLATAGQLARSVGDTDALVAAALANNRGVFSTTGFLDDSHFELIDAALDAVGPEPSAQRARLLALRALESVTSSDYTHRQALIDEAISIARQISQPTTLLDVLVRSLDAIRVPQSLGARLNITAEAESSATRLGDPVNQFWALFHRAAAATESADLGEAERCHRAAGEIADRIGQPTMRWLSGLTETWRLLNHGHTNRAETCAAETAQIGVRSGQPDALILHRYQIHLIRWHQGRGAEIVEDMEALHAQVPLPLFRGALAHLYTNTGRTDDARALLIDEVDRQFAHLGDWSTLSALAWWTEVAADARHEPAIDILLGLLEPWEEQMICSRTFMAGAVAHYIGVLDAARCDHKRADHAFRRALALHNAFPAPFHMARTQLEWAKSILADGQPGAERLAHEHLVEARTLAAKFGYAGLLERAADRP